MRLDDDAIEPRDGRGNFVVVLDRDRLRVEEAPGVIQLDLASRRQCGERLANLLDDCPPRHRRIERVDPQVAHHAAERALAIGQEDDGGRREGAVLVPLFFPHRGVGAMGIESSLGAAKIEHEPVVDQRTGTLISLPERRVLASASASRSRSCHIWLNTRWHQAFVTRARGVAWAPSWKRRLGRTGMSAPVSAFTPAATTCLSVISRSADPASTGSNGIEIAAAIAGRLAYGEHATNP